MKTQLKLSHCWLPVGLELLVAMSWPRH